jgi:6,7-dimethyl-8-ribityllumazine synthase
MSGDDPFADLATPPDGTGLRVGIVVSRFNGAVTGRLLAGAREALTEHGVVPDAITVENVPGALEIPVVAQAMIDSGGFDAIVALGCVIRGETTHYETVADRSAEGIARVGLDTGVPVTNGIITTESLKQANDRSGGRRGNAGRSAALAAIEVASIIRRFGAPA